MPQKSAPNRIQHFRELRGLSRPALAKRVGTSASQITKLERGERSLTQRWMERIGEALNVPPGEFMLRALSSPEAPSYRLDSARFSLAPASASGPQLRLAAVRVIGEVQAGVFREAIEWDRERQFDIMVELSGAAAHYSTFGLRVVGPSMNREFPDGSVAVCIRLLDLPKGYTVGPGAFVVVLRRNPRGPDEFEATIKQYEVDARGKAWLWPRSDDPSFQAPIAADGLTDGTHDDANDDVRIWAIVVANQKRYVF